METTGWSRGAAMEPRKGREKSANFQAWVDGGLYSSKSGLDMRRLSRIKKWSGKT
jgi:hypothetical protein